MGTMTGLPVVSRITRINDPECDAAALMMEEFRREVAPHLDLEKPHVVIGDGAYRSHLLRKKMHEVGLIERVHAVSHGDKPSSKANARKHDRMRFDIEGYPGWQCNGHYELSCCDQGHVWKEITTRDGRPIIRTGGDCPTHGRISITPGLWRKTKAGAKKGAANYRVPRMVRCHPDEKDQADYAFGNPLTYNDPIAKIYGDKRFGNDESLHGVLVSRFQYLKGKRWYRRKVQAQTDIMVIFSLMHAVAMEQRRRKAAAATSVAGSDPPTG